MAPRAYELLYIVKQEISSVDLEKLKEDISSIIDSYGGKIHKQKDIKYLNIKKLTYRIGKHTKGHYMLFNFYLEGTEGLNELNRKLSQADLLRHMIFRVDSFDENSSDLLKINNIVESTDAVDATVTNNKMPKSEDDSTPNAVA